MYRVQNYLKKSFLMAILLLPFGCDFKGESTIMPVGGELEELISKIDSGSNKGRCEAFFSIYELGKTAIPYLIERIDEPRLESFGLKSPNVHLSLQGESSINYKPLGVLYAYMVDFILLKNDLNKVTCADNQQEVLPIGPIHFVSRYGMIAKGEGVTSKIGKVHNFEELLLKDLTPDDMKEIKQHYSKWWLNNERHDLENLRLNYIKKISTPLSGTVYFWF